LEHSLASPAGLSATMLRTLETQLGIWHRDRRVDAASAEAALARAVGHDASDPDTLRMLAALQWTTPGRPLVETLLRLADATGDELDALYRAAQVAIETLNDPDVAQPI